MSYTVDVNIMSQYHFTSINVNDNGFNYIFENSLREGDTYNSRIKRISFSMNY